MMVEQELKLIRREKATIEARADWWHRNYLLWMFIKHI